jgi:hypothetical protein
MFIIGAFLLTRGYNPTKYFFPTIVSVPVSKVDRKKYGIKEEELGSGSESGNGNGTGVEMQDTNIKLVSNPIQNFDSE